MITNANLVRKDMMTFLERYDLIILLCDTHTYKNCLPLLLKKHNAFKRATVLKIKSGEASKSFSELQNILKQLLEWQVDRSALLVNLGGGVLSDLGGLAAGLYKRGIDYMNIPTTLMAMVDATHGGKTAIDFHGQKNSIGLFNPPKRILLDTDFLKTLPKRELDNGWVEMLKHALVFDSELWLKLKKLKPSTVKKWEPLVIESFQIKNIVTASDPKEAHFRKILNCGHTIGHALEAIALKKKESIIHGEAVAAGIIAESYIATEMKLLPEEDMVEIVSALSCYTHKMIVPTYREIEKLLYNDKKNRERSIRMSLLASIGVCEYDIAVEPQLIKQSLEFLKPLLS